MKNWHHILTFFTIVLMTITSCDGIKQQIEDKAKEIDPKVVEQIHEQVNEAQQVAAQASLRNDIIARARNWEVLKVPYGSFDEDDSNNMYDGYKADCSGFISYTWQLPKPGLGTMQFVRDNYAYEVTIDELQPGDALNNVREEKKGHMVLFVSWFDINHTKFNAYDLNTYPGYVDKKIFTLVKTNQGWTIKELEEFANGPYYAQRLSSLR